MVDVLTPGNLRRLVFVERRPNAVAVASGMYAALAAVVVTAIVASADELGQGLVDAAVYGLVGVALQGVALVVLELVVPGRFRDLITDERLHPAAIATAVTLLAVELERRRPVMTATERESPAGTRTTDPRRGGRPLLLAAVAACGRAASSTNWRC